MNHFAVIAEITKRVPQLALDPDDVRDGLSYMVINDLGRFICDKAGQSQYEEIEAGVRCLDELLKMDGEGMPQLVGDCLWGLMECKWSERIRPLLSKPLEKLQNRYLGP